MPNLDQTGSYLKVFQHVNDSDSDKYARFGTAIATRPFSQSVIPTGQWNELWMGMRFRISCSYSYSGSNAVPMLEEVPAFEWGLCNTTGSLYGQSGSVDTSDQFSMGLSTGDWSFAAGLAWKLYDDVANNRTAIGRGVTTLIRKTGSFVYQYPGSTYELSTFCNSYIDTSSYRCTNILRFFTGSNNDPTPRGERMSMRMLWLNAAVASTVNDVSASSQLASLMTASSWSELASAGAALGYTDTYLAAYDSHSAQNSVDGVYFSWYRMADSFDLSDVVCRRIY